MARSSHVSKTKKAKTKKVTRGKAEVTRRVERIEPVRSSLSYMLDVLTRPPMFGIGSTLIDIISVILKKPRKSLEEQKLDVVKELNKAKIAPEMFDVLLANELDRRLKVRFGVAFLLLTFLFTLASYSIVVLDEVYEWGISRVAITSLIIETPIQFVGLLYIIARNLFPEADKNIRRRTSRIAGMKD